MRSHEENSSQSPVSEDELAKMIPEARTTIGKIPQSSPELAERISRFNELYNSLPSKPDTVALIYRDPVTQSPTWSAIGNRLLVGRSPKRVANATGSTLAIQDEEMSRQHFEILFTSDHLYLLNDLKSLNGTCVDGIRRDTAVLIGGSEIRAGKTTFLFTGI